MSIFDVEKFLDQTTTEAATRRPPIPAGTILVGEITEMKPRVNQGKKDPSKTYTFLDVKIKVQVPAELVAIGQPEQLTFTDSVSLDISGDGQDLDWAPGKNAKLGSYRNALDLNQPGQAFSLRSMIGRMLKVKIGHDTYLGVIRDEVTSVAKA